MYSPWDLFWLVWNLAYKPGNNWSRILLAQHPHVTQKAILSLAIASVFSNIIRSQAAKRLVTAKQNTRIWLQLMWQSEDWGHGECNRCVLFCFSFVHGFRGAFQQIAVKFLGTFSWDCACQKTLGSFPKKINTIRYSFHSSNPTNPTNHILCS